MTLPTIDLNPARVDLTVRAGDTPRLRVPMTNRATGAPLNLAGYTFVGRLIRTGGVAEALTLVPGRTIPDPGYDSVLTITFPLLPAGTRVATWELRDTLGGLTWLAGSVTVRADTVP